MNANLTLRTCACEAAATLTVPDRRLYTTGVRATSELRDLAFTPPAGDDATAMRCLNVTLAGWI